MKYYGKKHKEEIATLEELWDNLQELSDMAKDYGIDDIFQDNGAKVLQQLVYLNMDVLPGREGNDCVSRSGTEWEMKSINLDTSAKGFSTNHHITYDIIDKYRQVPWTFAIYRGINLQEIYALTPDQLEPYFNKWEDQLRGVAHINNPKISVNFVRENGVRVYPIDAINPIDPDELV